MVSENITIADVHETVNRVLDDREPRIRERVAEQLQARDDLLESKLETLRVQLTGDISAQIGTLFRNGPVTRLEAGLRHVQETLEQINEDGCRAYRVHNPLQDRQGGDVATWGAYLRSIPPWGWALALLAIPALGPAAIENIVAVIKAVAGGP
jgi:hypothetical protein